MRATSFTSFAAMILLGACSHYSDDLALLEGKIDTQPSYMLAAAPQDIAPAAGMPAAQGTLAQNLAREYYTLARYENDTAYDYKASRDYTKKASLAAKGKIAAPARIETYDLPDDRARELAAARGALIDAFKTHNVAENAGALARAQTRFDCWLERAEEAVDEGHFAECKAEFEGAMASLVTPAAGEEADVANATYNIGFGPNATMILPPSDRELDYIAQMVKAPANAPYRLAIAGHRNAGVSGEYADRLLNARMNAVQAVLVNKGIAADRISLSISALPPVAEGKNVSVTIVAPSLSGTATRTFVPINPVPVAPAQ